MARDDAVSDLYVGDFDDFVARRNALAKELRAGGDTEAAARVRALKKPSRGAWAVNQVSAGQAKLRDELLGAGAKLRKAQERLVAGKGDTAALREAAQLEKAAVDAALDAACAVCEDAGAKLSPAALERVRKTLHAVALDEDVRRDFERHLLTTEHEAAGLGGLMPTGGAPARRKRDETKRRRDELKAAEAEAADLEARRQVAERDVELAREAAEGAQRELKRASRQLEKAEREAREARDRLEGLR